MKNELVFLLIVNIALSGLILPGYANIIGPDGISTCVRIQMEINEGKENGWITNYVLEHKHEAKGGVLKIIDSDCIYFVNVDEYLSNINDDSSQNLPPKTSVYDGHYRMTIFFEDYREDANRIEPTTTWKFKIIDGVLIADENRLNLSGSSVREEGFVVLSLDFPGGECYTFTTIRSRVGGSAFVFSAESDCTYGRVSIDAIKTSDLISELPIDNDDSDTQNSGGCLIATATFGSELAPQVQQLRELRDNTLLATSSGASFMTGFNAIYYSFSPAIADLERQSPVFKEVVKVAITPLITSLSLLNYVEIDSDQDVLGYGIGIIFLNIGMYFVAPAVLIYYTRKKLT